MSTSPPWQPPGYPQPQPPPRFRFTALKVIGAFVLGLVVMIVGISVIVANLGKVATSTGATAGSSASSGHIEMPAAPAGIGTPVRDGKFQFTITSVTYRKRAGGMFGEKAQGHFALLHVTVTNIGSESQTLDDSAQYVYADGRQYSADSAADLYLNGTSNSVFLNDINPGNTVHGVIAFDMPANLKPSKAVLHDSIFSNGVTVSLR